MEDGYDLKGDQAETLLKGRSLSYAGVEFFNSFEDESERLTQFVLGLVEGLHQRRCENLRVVVDDVNLVVHNSKLLEVVEVNEVRRQAAHRLRVWLDSHRHLGDFEMNLEESLVSAMRDAHPSSVRASVRRLGDWDNLKYEHQLGYGARAMVAGLVSHHRASFKEVADNVLNDPELKKGADLVNQAVRIFDARIEEMLQASQNFGRTTHAYDLKPDGNLWSDSNAEWGKGQGYRVWVVQRHEEWFDAKGGILERRARELVDRGWESVLNRVSSILE